jgi:hypothetical protein
VRASAVGLGNSAVRGDERDTIEHSTGTGGQRREAQGRGTEGRDGGKRRAYLPCGSCQLPLLRDRRAYHMKHVVECSSTLWPAKWDAVYASNDLQEHLCLTALSPGPQTMQSINVVGRPLCRFSVLSTVRRTYQTSHTPSARQVFARIQPRRIAVRRNRSDEHDLGYGRSHLEDDDDGTHYGSGGYQRPPLWKPIGVSRTRLGHQADDDQSLQSD